MGFDRTAPSFDQDRPLPVGVAEAIRSAIQTQLHYGGEWILDLGAGTGRIGKAFVPGDRYVGVDLSIEMLRQFARKRELNGIAPFLVQADGEFLPFPNAVFRVVLLMQVVTGARSWRALLAEALRVLCPGGVAAVGRVRVPEDGVDSRLKAQLEAVLLKMGIERSGGQRAGAAALAWLQSKAARHTSLIAAEWQTSRSAAQFLARHQTGSRFVMLPRHAQDEALQRLSQWASAEFGSLEAEFPEHHVFGLDVFQF